MSAGAHCCLFDTAIGRCGIAWRGRSVTRVALPEDSERRLRARFAGARHADPPARVRAAIDGIRRLLAGEAVDLGFVEVDYGGASAFEREVYVAARTIPPGRTTTYGELARAAGRPGSARAAGLALGRNPVPILVPCHRVLAGGGRAGGFSAPGGLATKFRILALERARPEPGPLLFDTLPLAVRARDATFVDTETAG